MNKKEEYRQGDVIYVNLLSHGHVQGGLRPCIVVSNNTGNQYSGVLIVVPCTTSQTKKEIPTHAHFVMKNSRTGELIKNTALCEQILTIDKTEIKSKTGKLGFGVFEKVQNCIKISLHL